MIVELLTGRTLDADLVRVWVRLQAGNPALASPYFSPEYARIIASVRDDVEIAVIYEGREVVAIFPFQRCVRSVGIPLGGVLSDYQGLICRPGFLCEPRELIKKCRLVAWDFDHLLASQTCFEPFHQYHGTSPLMDLSQGYEAYAAKQHAVKSEQIKMRRIERDIGPLRFVDHAADAALLQQVLAWKSQQYIASSKRDLFALDWPRTIVERIHATQTEGCAGMLSLLYAGERLVAGHMGMRSRTVWHHWFPAYDKEFAKYSPGLILLLKMAEHAPSLGLRAIDFGGGMLEWKERFMNVSVPLASGSVELPSLLSFRRATRRKLKAGIDATPLAAPLRRCIRRMRGT